MELIQIVAAVGLLVGNFYFVAVEFSITKARPTMLEELVAEGVRGARSFKHGVDNIDNYLSACQLGITVCSIGLGITAEPLVKELIETRLSGPVLGIAAATVGFILAYAIVSTFHVVLGELTPKSLAIARWRRTGLLLLPPMRAFYLVTRPVVDLFNWLGNLVLRPFGIPPASEADAEPHSENELRSLLAESESRGMLEPEELAFAVGAFTFGDRRTRVVMVPRRSVVVLRRGTDLRDAARTAAESGHRRLPLVDPERGLDEPLGIVHLSALARALADGADTDLAELARPLLETSEVTLLDDLLEELRRRGERMALVRDEHATAVGIVTVEDIVEQVVGGLRDEFEPRGEPAAERADGELRVAGDAHVHHLARELGVDFGIHQEATIGGLVIERLGHVPAVGDQVEAGQLRLRVLGVEDTRVTQVAVTRAEDGGA